MIYFWKREFGICLFVLSLAFVEIKGQLINTNIDNLDYKEIKYKEAEKKAITLYNEGDKPLLIENITTSCNCTLVEHHIEKIMPKDSAQIFITYDSKKLGYFRRSIIIKSNAINADKFGENYFYIEGKVIK